MKQLQLNPPLLIITMGYPGAGKTYFARQFADQYNLPKVSEDRIRYELFEEPTFNDDEAQIIERVAYISLEELLITKQAVIYDGSCLRFEQRKALYELAADHNYQTLTIWLQTDLATSTHRAQNVDRRNQDRKYSFKMQPATFDAIKTQLERPQEKENALIISGKHAFKSQCLTALRKIALMYGNSNKNMQKQPLGERRRVLNGATPKSGRPIIQ